MNRKRGSDVRLVPDVPRSPLEQAVSDTIRQESLKSRAPERDELVFNFSAGYKVIAIVVLVITDTVLSIIDTFEGFTFIRF